MSVFSLWIGRTNKLIESCIQSWIDCGYKVDFYCTFENDFRHLDVNLHHFTIPVEDRELSLQHVADKFRYNYLYKNGGTWLDTDIFLLKPLPTWEILINSELTNQSGAFKSSKIFIPNISILRTPKEDKLIEDIIVSINKIKIKSGKNNNDYQKLLQKKILTNNFKHYNDFILPPNIGNPIHWSYTKELYTLPINKWKKKYDVSIQEDYSETVAVHLWNNIANRKGINFNNPIENSFYAFLLK